VVPEDIGRAAAQLLLEEVSRGGVTDGCHQGLLLLLAALGPEEMNEVSAARQTGMGRMLLQPDGLRPHTATPRLAPSLCCCAVRCRVCRCG
jgi:hypothetical protein